jgi:hypothetical protein
MAARLDAGQAAFDTYRRQAAFLPAASAFTASVVSG